MLRVPFILTDAARGHSIHAPQQATAGAAGFDLTAATKAELVPHERALVDTGIAVEIPEGYAGLILPRSGLALKKGLTVLNAPGLIDSDYRGNVKVLLWNSNGEGKVETVSAGDRIAQLVIVKIEQPHFQHVAWLSSSARGAGGFGSTGGIDISKCEEAQYVGGPGPDCDPEG